MMTRHWAAGSTSDGRNTSAITPKVRSRLVTRMLVDAARCTPLLQQILRRAGKASAVHGPEPEALA